MLKVVLDTNIFISGLLFNGKQRKILELWQARRFELIISDEILTELRAVLYRKKFNFNKEQVDFITTEIKNNSIQINPDTRYKFSAYDADDNIIIDCAIAGKCDYIVSGDSDILRLKKIAGISLIDSKEFLQLIQR